MDQDDSVTSHSWHTAWLRRTGSTRVLRRHQYELELVASDGGRRRHVTSVPLRLLEPRLGVGDSWSVVHAADAAWDGTHGAWVTLDPTTPFPPPDW